MTRIHYITLAAMFGVALLYLIVGVVTGTP